MRLVVDASSLVAEGLRARGPALFNHSGLDLLMTMEVASETGHELERRVGVIISRGALAQHQGERLLDLAYNVIRESAMVAGPEVYVHFLAEARSRMPRDQADAPSLALALALECGIWTLVRDFFGCGVATWTTSTLLGYLDRHSS